MNFFFLSKDKNNVNLECLNNDKINLHIYLDDIYYRSGDIFRCILEVRGPEKYIGNIKLDYVVLYIYGICIFNNDIININEELIKRHHNIYLPFYKKEDTNEKKFLIFYTNSIIVCSDIFFNKCNNIFYYSLECLLPHFIPPTYNGKNVKIKYYVYVQALKRLYKNTKDFITKKYEANYSIPIINTKYKNNPILNFSYFPIKPYDIKSCKENQRHTYLQHNFYIYIKELGNTKIYMNNLDSMDNKNNMLKNKNSNNNNIHNNIHNNNIHNNNIHNKHILYNKTMYNISYIPTHIYNNIQKSNFDYFLCMYNLLSQRKEDSSLFLLNYIIPNYNYFYYLHCFLYLIYHYNYFQNIIKYNDNYSNFYSSCIKNNNTPFVFSLLLDNIEKGNTDCQTNYYKELNQNESKNIKEMLSNQQNQRYQNKKENINDHTNDINKFHCYNNLLNEKEKKKKNLDMYHMNDIHPFMYNDKDLHDFYFCKYENFNFNNILYEPVLWCDNLIVDNYNKRTPSEEKKNIHIQKLSDVRQNQSDELVHQSKRKNHHDNNEDIIKGQNNNTCSNKKMDDLSNDNNLSNDNDLSNDNLKSDTEREIKYPSKEKISKNKYSIIYNNKYYKMDTIIKYMIKNNMFRYYVNLKKMKNDFISNKSNDKNSVIDKHNVSNKKNNKIKMNSPNIYNINTNNKNVCIISLMDKINNKITNVFNYNNSIINININLQNAEICTKHIDISLKRIEKIRMKNKIFHISKNRSYYDEHDIMEEEYYSSSSNKTISCNLINMDSSSSSSSSSSPSSSPYTSSLQLKFPSKNNILSKKKEQSYNVLCNTKTILEQHISTLSCSEKNINIILNEDIIPTFSNDIISIDYFIDMDFYCFNNKNNTLQPFSLQTSFDHVYNMTFRIPIYIIDTIQHEGYENINSTNLSASMIDDEPFDEHQICLKDGHKYEYVDKRCYIKKLEI
ncbi:hypothetical protein PFFVO_01794 [Plasmodium falciparum Vietnam Oak-Knoll (FVO)]|uniref:Uncharacterized protein n=1 Tax=Plasmodium falciparum Vietnam Oak-Knoll (FVO) TaxID=1036723 RepID=A0A024V8V9_PLAFA|nr:hypothetical protein PFFVO_01794 [Plasmodium falciparum Vietnam Oak-Knoll (FVO)]